MTERVLVVGASSPLGRAVSAELMAAGHAVVRTSRPGGVGVEALDVAHISQMSEVLASVDPSVVVYLARPETGDSISAVDEAISDFRLFVARCNELGVGRIVFASSASVYGTQSALPRREVDAVPADSPGAALKLGSETALAEAASTGTTTTVALRIFNIYGPGFSRSLVNRLFAGRLFAGDGERPTVFETDEFVRDYIHVTDVASAFTSAIAVSVRGSAVVNVGSGVGTSNRELLALGPTAEYVRDPDFLVASFSVADTTFARSFLDFESRLALATALQLPSRYLRGEAPD
jgi:UDP-glucose 4-epimerase